MFDRKTVVSECAIVCATFFAGFMPCEVSDTRRELGIADTDIIRTSYYAEPNVLRMLVCDSKTGQGKLSWVVVRLEKTNAIAVSRMRLDDDSEADLYFVKKGEPEFERFEGYCAFMQARKTSSYWVTFGNHSYQVSENEFTRASSEVKQYF